MTPEARAFVEGVDIGRQRRRLEVEHASLMATMMLQVVIIQHSTDRLLKRIDAVQGSRRPLAPGAPSSA
jgi:hypothetical protein